MSVRSVILIAALWGVSVALAVTGNHAAAGMVALVSIVGLRMLRLVGPRPVQVRDTPSAPTTGS